ncbi:YafY family protein [Agromyces sp. LHK192]|uniref:helix-turn-helix transcriptional regulator n=1 Tax=Agromyces sp. LHK192 TaxID=2498704 RepID=UPI000FD8E2B2|nr:WYL domain-containing protein [Agromyces sp. LHK192]
MLDTSARLLKLLSLLQIPREWTGVELAERLEVSARTVRTDIGKLRELGYAVDARPGVAGGYRLVAGTAMPPLVLDDDEAVAIAIGLTTAMTRGIRLGESSVTALGKVEQVMPPHLRQRVDAARAATSVADDPDASLDVSVFSAIASAIRWNERLRFDYATHRGTPSRRLTEPHRLINWGSRWYLLAWDVERGDWRTFRADRIVPQPPTGVRFRPREIDEELVVAHVMRGVGRALWAYRARILVQAPAAEVEAKIGPPAVVTPVGERACEVEVGSDDPDRLALWITQLDAEIEVLEGDELIAAFARLAARLRRAAGAAGAAEG